MENKKRKNMFGKKWADKQRGGRGKRWLKIAYKAVNIELYIESLWGHGVQREYPFGLQFAEDPHFVPSSPWFSIGFNTPKFQMSRVFVMMFIEVPRDIMFIEALNNVLNVLFDTDS